MRVQQRYRPGGDFKVDAVEAIAAELCVAEPEATTNLDIKELRGRRTRQLARTAHRGIQVDVGKAHLLRWSEGLQPFLLQ